MSNEKEELKTVENMENKEEEKPALKANEFMCDSCTFINEFNEKSLYSANCKMCGEKKKIICTLIYEK